MLRTQVKTGMLSLAAHRGLTGQGGEIMGHCPMIHRGGKKRGALPIQAELIKIKRASFTQASDPHKVLETRTRQPVPQVNGQDGTPRLRKERAKAKHAADPCLRGQMDRHVPMWERPLDKKRREVWWTQ